MRIEQYVIVSAVISVLSILINNKHSQNLSCVFYVLIAQWLSLTILSDTDTAFFYYGIASLLDVITFRLLQSKNTAMALYLQVIVFGSLLAQSFGYVSYQFGISPTHYNNTIHTLAGMQAAIMLWGDGGIAKYIGNNVHDLLARGRNSMGIFKT